MAIVAKKMVKTRQSTQGELCIGKHSLYCLLMYNCCMTEHQQSLREIIASAVSHVVKHPFLYFLIFLLSAITLANIRSEFYLAGWDNYSSYFNLKTNIFRTFFATWREYRGIGVPSDAEATDIFRQLFYLIIHFIVSEKLLDQIYYLFCLNCGVIGMYLLAQQVIKVINARHINPQNIHPLSNQVFAFFAAFFYLFNLNSFSVFYSPMIPFTNRFMSLPLIIFLLYRLIDKRWRKREIFFLVIAIILTSGSYLTPTVIITSIIAFCMVVISVTDVKKSLLIMISFVFLNAFWILPFGNYIIQRSPLVSLARTFIEINEGSLNKNPEYFSLEKQSTLYPSFLDINFLRISGGIQEAYPGKDDLSKFDARMKLLLFPVLYITGSLMLLFQRKRRLLWIPGWILIFLTLSTKEYGPLGQLYILCKTYIPFFDVLFRISDTKFHAYISLAGSLAAAYALWKGLYFCIQQLEKMRRLILIIPYVLIGFILVWYSTNFYSYFKGSLINPYSYTLIPDEYFSMAKTVNADPDRVRVLHLPMDQWHHYWRSFEWGYLGSAFYNFILDKPYIDNTFEPGSMENVYIHSKLNKLIDQFVTSTNAGDKDDIAHRYYKLLQSLSIRYLILDETINPQQDVRNIAYHAKQISARDKQMIKYLEKLNLVKITSEYTISIDPLIGIYKKLNPNIVDIGPKQSSIFLYTVNDVSPSVSFVPYSTNIQPDISNALETDVDQLIQSSYTQDPAHASVSLPFQEYIRHATIRDNQITLATTSSTAGESDMIASVDQNTTDTSYMVDVFGRISGNKIIIDIYHRYLPDIGGKSFRSILGRKEFALPDSLKTSEPNSQVIGDWIFSHTSQVIPEIRLSLNDVVMPLPRALSNTDVYIGSAMLQNTVVDMSLLTLSKTVDLPIDDALAEAPLSACRGYEDALYTKSAEFNSNALTLTSKNGSICSQGTIPFVTKPNEKNIIPYTYIEADFRVSGSINQNSVDLDPLNAALGSAGTLPKIVNVCIRDFGVDDCVNTHQYINLPDTGDRYRIPVPLKWLQSAPLSISIGSHPANHTELKTTISNLRYYYFTPSESVKLQVNPMYPSEIVHVRDTNVSFPLAISQYAYNRRNNQETFSSELGDCATNTDKDRRHYMLNGAFINIQTGCRNYAAIAYNHIVSSPYIFYTSYWLGSGQQPTLLISNSKEDKFYERASLYQGYPKLVGTKTVQDPRLLETPESYLPTLKQITYADSMRYIPSLYKSTYQTRRYNAHIVQDTVNRGVLGIKEIAMIEYPHAWQSLKLTPVDSNTFQQFTTPSQVPTAKQILPSLWSVKLDLVAGQDYLMRFSEGYDLQWILVGVPSVHSRCDGFANCYRIRTDKSVSGTFYIFYWPEVLSLFGWFITLMTAILLVVARRTRALKSLI